MKVVHYSIYILLISFISSQLTISPTCIINTENGSNIDLNLLRSSSSDYKYDVGKYMFYSNFCGSLIDKCKGRDTSSGYFLKNYHICAGVLTQTWNPQSVEYISNDNKGEGVKLHFTQGDRCYLSGYYNANGSTAEFYDTSYLLKCNPIAETARLVTINKITNCKYDFVFETKLACLAGGESGMSSKMILIYLLLCFIVYIGVFGFRNYKQNQEEGVVNAFPHKAFWKDMIELSKEGVNFTYIKVSEKVRSFSKGSSAYNTY